MSAALWLFAGLAGGSAHFALLRWNTSLYIRAGGVPLALGVQVLRLATVSLLLAFAAWHGALPLLLAALGIMIARPLLLRRMQATP